MNKNFDHFITKFSHDNRDYINKLSEQMGTSAVVLNPLIGNWKRDAGFLLQLAMCMVLDKPLYIAVPNGTVLPEKLKKIADGIEFFEEGNNESLQAAIYKLMTTATGKSLSA